MYSIVVIKQQLINRLVQLETNGKENIRIRKKIERKLRKM